MVHHHDKVSLVSTNHGCFLLARHCGLKHMPLFGADCGVADKSGALEKCRRLFNELSRPLVSVCALTFDRPSKVKGLMSSKGENDIKW